MHHTYPHNGAIADPQIVHASVTQLGKITLHKMPGMAQAKQPMLANTHDLHGQPPGRNNSEQHVGRATKLTAPSGLPGQITLVRSPNGVKRTAVQLTEPQQQLQQQQQQQKQQQQQQQQQSTKGQRSQRGRKSKVPAVAKVIAEQTDVAREVQNATDMSHNEESDVSQGAQDVAGQISCLIDSRTLHSQFMCCMTPSWHASNVFHCNPASAF